jgi:diguanylate cyclase (GGDEF)-like protein
MTLSDDRVEEQFSGVGRSSRHLGVDSNMPPSSHGGAHERSRDNWNRSGHLLEAQRLQILNEISRALASRLDLRTVYDTIYEQISRVMDTSMFVLALTRENGDVYLPYVREFGALSLDLMPPVGNSVTGHVLDLGQPLLFHSWDQYKRYAVSHNLPIIVLGDETKGSAQSMMYAPLNTGSLTLGTLSVQSTSPYAYTNEDLDVFTAIASQAAVAIQNARLYFDSMESARRRQSLLQVAETVNSSLELPVVLRAILDSINEVIPYHLAAILLPNFVTGMLDTVGAVGGLTEKQRENLKISFGRGVTGLCFQKGEAVVVGDVSKFPGYIEGSGVVKSEAAVPLRRGDTVVGVLNVERTTPHAFTHSDVELLSLFATQAAIAIENARLFEEQRNRVTELQAIQNFVQALTCVHSFESVAELIEMGLQQLLGVDESVVYLLPKDSDVLVPVLNEDDAATQYLTPRSPRRVGEGIVGAVLQTGKADIILNSKTDPRVANDIRSRDWEMTMIAAPFRHGDEIQGVIAAAKLGADALTRNHVRLLDVIASHAAIGFDRCRLYEELRRQATTDELTGLYNRRYLLGRLTEEKSRAMRNNHPLAALVVDVDKFKTINDGYGHDAGDTVLRELGQLVRTQLRTEDIVARYGGEEFCVLLPEASVEEAVQVGERLCQCISTTLLGRESGVRHVQVSIGISALDINDQGEEIITRADHAMYEAKRQGGNRACAWSAAVPAPVNAGPKESSSEHRAA